LMTARVDLGAALAEFEAKASSGLQERLIPMFENMFATPNKEATSSSSASAIHSTPPSSGSSSSSSSSVPSGFSNDVPVSWGFSKNPPPNPLPRQSFPPIPRTSSSGTGHTILLTRGLSGSDGVGGAGRLATVELVSTHTAVRRTASRSASSGVTSRHNPLATAAHAAAAAAGAVAEGATHLPGRSTSGSFGSSESSNHGNSGPPSPSKKPSFASLLPAPSAMDTVYIDVGAFITMASTLSLAERGYPITTANESDLGFLFVAVSADEVISALRQELPLNSVLLSHKENKSILGARHVPFTAKGAKARRGKNILRDNAEDAAPTSPGGTAIAAAAAGVGLDTGEDSQWQWRVSGELGQFYDLTFDSLRAGGTMHIGPDMWLRYVVGSLGLPYGIAAATWRMADVDCDDHLDDAEFYMAHHLVSGWMHGQPLPRLLPAELVPASKLLLASRIERGMRRVRKVFISYRWFTADARPMALWLYKELLALQYEAVFLDIKNLGSEVIASQIEERIIQYDAVMPLLTKGCYDRCSDPKHPNDAVKLEVATALKHDKVIVPLFVPGYYDSVNKMSLPEEMRDVLDITGVMCEYMVDSGGAWGWNAGGMRVWNK
jgi:hypothetical protein